MMIYGSGLNASLIFLLTFKIISDSNNTEISNLKQKAKQTQFLEYVRYFQNTELIFFALINQVVLIIDCQNIIEILNFIIYISCLIRISRSQYNYQTGQLLFIINQRMNVVRDLRNTITHLEAELERKQKHIKKQQQDYEEVIASLQAENEKLKQLLQGDSISHLPKEDQFLKEESQHGSVKKDCAPYASNTEWTDLVNENTFLRNEIVELSSTYQKQIDQLVFYFQKIKNENKRISPGHHAGQIKMMGNWIQACLKDFESEREKYDRKLMECGQTLDIYEKKFQEQNEYINQLRSLLQESEEKLKIVSRIHW